MRTLLSFCLYGATLYLGVIRLNICYWHVVTRQKAAVNLPPSIIARDDSLQAVKVPADVGVFLGWVLAQDLIGLHVEPSHGVPKPLDDFVDCALEVASLLNAQCDQAGTVLRVLKFIISQSMNFQVFFSLVHIPVHFLTNKDHSSCQIVSEYAPRDDISQEVAY